MKRREHEIGDTLINQRHPCIVLCPVMHQRPRANMRHKLRRLWQSCSSRRRTYLQAATTTAKTPTSTTTSRATTTSTTTTTTQEHVCPDEACMERDRKPIHGTRDKQEHKQDKNAVAPLLRPELAPGVETAEDTSIASIQSLASLLACAFLG